MTLYSILKCLFLLKILCVVKCKFDKERFIDQNNAELIQVISTLQREVAELKSNAVSGGVTYVQWGRTSCPSNGTEFIYKGYMAGASGAETGGGANNLSLLEDPSFAGYVDGHHCGAHLFGTEIEIDDHVSRVLFGRTAFNQNIPCAVCGSPMISHVMIPSRVHCYSGWTEEYTGYLIASYPNKPQADFVCLAAGLEFVPNGTANDDDHVLRPVEEQCGAHRSLPCPPYVQGRELACVVCTK